jgi:hypothetical protein
MIKLERNKSKTLGQNVTAQQHDPDSRSRPGKQDISCSEFDGRIIPNFFRNFDSFTGCVL